MSFAPSPRLAAGLRARELRGARYGPGSPPAAPLATGRPETYRVAPAITCIRASDMPTASAVTYRPPRESTARPNAFNCAALIVSPGLAASTTPLPPPSASPAIAFLKLMQIGRAHV